jgi:hypothetical protein
LERHHSKESLEKEVSKEIINKVYGTKKI